MAASLPDRSRAGRTAAAIALLWPIAWADPGGAQEPVVGVEVDPVLTGTLYLAGTPADSGTVSLHRVSPDESASLDSIRVGPGGEFQFTLPNLPIPGSGEVFFASTRYDGIVYPGEMITDPVQLDGEYRVEAFASRTVSGSMAFGISRRETWITEGPLGWRVLDVLEIENPDTTTIVAEPGATVWQYPLPEAAVGPRVIQMGPVQGAVEFSGNRLLASNPVVPAQNYYVVQYDLESIEFDIPMPGPTGVAQLLFETPLDADGVAAGPDIRVEGLARSDPGEIEFGTDFAYWVGQDLFDQNIEVRLGTGAQTDPAVWLWVGVALALSVIGAGTLMARRGSPARQPRMRRDVLVDLARLDEENEGVDASDAEARSRYADRRAALLRELEDVAGGRGRA